MIDLYLLRQHSNIIEKRLQAGDIVRQVSKVQGRVRKANFAQAAGGQKQTGRSARTERKLFGRG